MNIYFIFNNEYDKTISNVMKIHIVAHLIQIERLGEIIISED